MKVVGEALGDSSVAIHTAGVGEGIDMLSWLSFTNAAGAFQEMCH